MKKAILLFIITLIGSTLYLQAINTRSFSISRSNQDTRLLKATDYECQIHYTISDLQIETVKNKDGVFDDLSIAGYGYTNRIGEPKLPVLSKIIYVPVGAKVSYDILSHKQKIYTKSDSGLQNRIIPAQRSISKSEDPSKVPFIFNQSTYNSNKFNSNAMFTVNEIGYMRGVRIFLIEFEPVRYNPVSGEMQVSYDVQIKVNFENPDLSATHELRAKTASYEFEQLYSKSIFNWSNNERDVIVAPNPTKLLILTPASYVTTLQPFVDWKKQQGFNVVVTTVGTGGTVTNSTSAIISYMQSVWSAATAQDPAPTYLLIVGDTSTSGDNIIANTGTSGSHVTDLTYVRLQGGDFIPEMYYGRFSVSSSTELTNIINKSITFEKTTMPDLSYLGNVVMIAGADATYAPTYGNGQINYGTTYYFNSGNGITSNTYLYPASASSDATIIANANNGRGYINYTAHGSETSWADPTFAVSDVNAMTNTNKYGVMVGNCCVTNAFGTGVCFGESIIRKANAAGVVYIGATNNSYWDEDYWWGVGYKGTATGSAPAYSASTLGAYDAMFHTHGEATTDWAQTVGETNYMGNLAVEQSSSTRKPYYWEIYSIMGDPSLMPYYGVPTVNTTSYPGELLIGATSIAITAEPQSRVAVTQSGVLYGTGIVGTSGSLNLVITPFSGVGTADIVITRQNRITKIGTISIIPNSGPYVSLDSWSYADNNNNTPESGEAGSINATFKNVGSASATNVTCTLSSTNPGISFTDNSAVIASLASGASVTINGAFSFNIANNVADQTQPLFNLSMVSGSYNWDEQFTMTVNAPNLAFGTMIVSDPTGNNNGRLDPGETVTITMPLLNTGHAASVSGTATMTSPTTGIIINTGTTNFSSIATSGNTNLTFSLTASADMSIGSVASLVFAATAGSCTANKTEDTTIGIILEGFETGGFNAFPWTFGGNANWTADNTTSQSGSYSAKSGTITHSQTTTMQTVRVLTTSGSLSFWYKVSSEAGYDYLKFYIDGVLQNSPGWAGTINWTQATYTLTAGTRTLKWEYMKDGSDNAGSDCVWVDNIIFPASTAPSVYNPPQNLLATPGNASVNLSWQAPASGTPTGYKIYKNSILLTTVAGLSYSDTNVINETTYSYYIKAVYSGGESDPTSTVNATPSAAPTIQIGTGTTTSQGLPIEPYFGYTYSQSIYLQSEINLGAVNITKLYWYYNGNSAWTDSIKIYMGHTSLTSFASTSSWIDSSNLSLVYDGTLAATTTPGWIELILTTPFAYNNTQNLVIAVDENTSGWHSSSDEFYCSSVASARSIHFYNDTTNPDPASPPISGTYLYTKSYIPNVKLTLLPIQTEPIFTLNPASLAYGNVFIGNTPAQNFTITNTGGGTLSGVITTPTGYNVATASRSSSDLTVSKTITRSRNNIQYSLNYGQSQTYTLTFAPAAAQSYNGNVTITSSDTDNSSTNLIVTGTGLIPVFNAPVSLSATASHANVYLAWTVPVGSSGTLIGYKVYRNSVLITSTPIANIYYNDSGLVNGTAYQYYVTAAYTSPAGESASSNIVNATPSAFPPRNLSIIASHSTAALTWQAPVAGTAYRYKVYRNASLVATITGLTYSDIGLTDGTNYSYYVTATYINPTDESVASNIVNATPIALPPQNLVGNAGNATVFLSWQAPAAGTPGLYRILRNGVYYKNLSQTSYIDSSVVNGTTYSYSVKAVYNNPTTESNPSNTVIMTPNTNTIITIGTGTVTGLGLPVEPYQGYTYSQSIYLQSEINLTNKTINRLSWQYAGGTAFTDAVKIYMCHTDLTEFATSSSWIPVNNMTLVFDGNVTTTTIPGWIEVPLSTPFNYNNAQNIVIAVDENTSSWHLDTDEFYCSGAAVNRSIVFSSRFTNTDPASPPTTGTTLYARTAYPNLKLSLIESLAPLLSITPANFAFGPVILGNSSNLTLTLQNVSGQAISGTITTPSGYSVAQSRRDSGRNELNFSLSASQTVNYTAIFSPLLVQDYNGNIIISCNDLNHTTYTIAASGSGYFPPTATLNLTSIETSLSAGQIMTENFTICNSGSQNLIYSTEVSESWISCSPANDTVIPSVCFPVSVQLDATSLAAGDYNGVISFISNDPDNPSQDITVTLHVAAVNHPPVLNLPASISFNKNQVHIEDFSAYISDADQDPLTLTYAATRNVDVQISGMQATFSPANNWYGSTQVTFTVSDGHVEVSDEITVNVLATDLPTWTTVTYPNNPATVYGVITIDGVAASTNDQVSAFVGTECRGTGTIVLNNGHAYTTMLVNLASSGETVIFKVYDTSVDLVYVSADTPALAFGQVLGETAGYPISMSSTIFIETPIPVIEHVAEGVKISWSPVSNATQYFIYTSSEANSGFTQIATVTTTEYIDTLSQTACFYKVVAADGSPARGGVK